MPSLIIFYSPKMTINAAETCSSWYSWKFMSCWRTSLFAGFNY